MFQNETDALIFQEFECKISHRFLTFGQKIKGSEDRGIGDQGETPSNNLGPDDTKDQERARMPDTFLPACNAPISAILL